MAEYEFQGTIDSGGNINGTIRNRSDGDGGPIGIIGMAVIYALCLLGGFVMIKEVAQQSPVCIVPAVLGFVIMLIPIVIATKTGDFFASLLQRFYEWSDLLIGLIIVMYWIAYISQAVSIVILIAITIGLMYLAPVAVYKVYQGLGVAACVVNVAIPVLVYLICCATTEDITFGHLALIPTIDIILSFLIREIANIYDFKYQCLSKDITKSIVKMVAFVCIVASVFLFSGFVSNNKADLLQTAKDYVSENKFSEARVVLQDIKSEEAKELYDSIRYKDIKVGEIVYNGYYKSANARSISEDGVAFVCLDVVDGQALLISLDVIGLGEQYKAMLDEEFYTSEYSFDLDRIASTTIDDQTGKFFLLSKEQYDRYVTNESLDDYLKSANVSNVAKKQKKSVDEDTYKWTQPYIDIWLLNDFSKESGDWIGKIGTINATTGEYQKVGNYKVYAGIRLCYCANVE